MTNPIPFKAEVSGDLEEAPSGAIPISLYGDVGGGGAVNSVNGQTGAVELTAEDIEVAPGTSVYDGVMGLTQGAAHQADELHNLKLRVTALESALEGLEG